MHGYVRPLSRFSAAGQIAGLAEHGVPRERVYVEGDGPETLDALIRSLRRGEAVAVVRLHVLAPPKLRTADRPRLALWAAIRAIEARGAHIIEVDSGRSTATKAERDDMIADAIEALTHAGRAPRSRDQSGRPPKTFPPEVVERARAVWFDLVRHRTNADAVQAGPQGWAMTRYYRTFGPSGRNN
jgi:hypothetical protein